MENNFVETLKDKMREAGITSAELARRSGVTKQNIGRLLNATPHPITGAPPTTTRETVEKLAKALHWNAGEALHLAGYASEFSHNLPAFLYQIEWHSFTAQELAEIESFIRFKAGAPASRVAVKPPAVGIPVRLEEIFSEEDKNILLGKTHNKRTG